MKPVLFFDFDDTIFRIRHLMARFLKDHYDFDMDLGKFVNGSSLHELLNQHLPPNKQISATEFYSHCSANFTGSIEWHNEGEPVEGALDTIPRLHKEYDLWIVTARDSATRPAVEFILNKYFKEMFQGIHFVWKFDETKSEFVGTPKKDFIYNFDLHREKVAFFDDSPGEIEKVQDVIPSYLFDPHGFHVDEHLIRNRIISWQEIADLLL